MLREGSRGQTPGYSHRFIGAIAVLAGIVVIGVPFLDRLAISQPLIHSIGRSRDTTVADATHGDFPEVAWLMTFPNSGTTYTLQLIQQYTNTTTATNYGNEQGVHGTSVPVHPWMENGPFFRYPEWNVPSRYILTKTHCGGTAMSPTPTDYIETARSFEIACRSGNRIVDDTKVEVVYSMDIPKRAVHLFRNPFDNIVARLHLSEKKWGRMEDRSELLQTFNSTREGFRAWCYFMDSRAATQEQKSHFIDTELWEIAKDVPCHAELIRYTWWHNYALELTRLKSLPVHFLFYEDYTDNWETTVKQLFQFLDLSPALGAEPLEFISGKHYADYFDPEDIVMAKLLVETLASPEAWALLKNYFP